MVHHPNDQGEYKTKPITIKFYPSDLAAIDKEAKKLNLNRTDYITQCALNPSIEKSHIFKVNWQTYRTMGDVARQLNQIGNNINQIAKVFHTERLEGSSVPAHYPLPEELNAIRSYISTVSQEVNKLRLLIVGKSN